MRILILMLIVLIPCVGPVSAQSTAPLGEIEQLVAQLSSEKWQERQEAAERLVRLGDDASARLQRLLQQSEDPEVRTLAESALAEIEQNRRTGASIITLHARKMPVAELFKKLSEQAGAKMEPMPPNLFETARIAPVSVEIDHESFWAAMKQITAKTGLTLLSWNNETKLTMGQPPQGPSCLTGPYMVIANRVVRTRSMDLGGGGTQKQFSVQLTVLAEPKLRMLRATSGAKIEEAIDENGVSLLAPAMPSGFYSRMGNIWQVQATLNEPDNMGEKIALLRGVIDADLCTEVEHLEISDILNARNVEKASGNAHITIVEVARKGNIYELRLRIRMKNGADWSQIPTHDIILQDAAGVALQTRGSSGSSFNDTYESTIQFASEMANGRAAGEPSKLVWDFPVESKQVRIPFEFRDLSIP